jgi:hypothetical protein
MEKSDNNELPKIKILALERNKDGKLDVEFEVSEDFLEYAQFELQQDNISHEELSAYVQDMIEKAINKQDGFEIKKSFTHTHNQ